MKRADVVITLGSVFLLMLVNWGIEVIKWRRLLRPVEKVSVWRAIESVFCGFTVAIFTPSRIGEYGGRVFFLSPRKRIVGVVAMATGTIAQMVLTNVFGIIAGLVFLYRFIHLDPNLFYLIVAAGILIVVFLCIFYFHIKWIQRLLMAIPFTRKYKKFYAVLGRYSKSELLKILLISVCRYAVFNTQYLILLAWLIPGLHYADILLLLFVFFFIQATLPTFDVFDIGVRAITATYLFGYITDRHVEVIATAACIWLINIIIPAILGSYFVFKLNFFGNSRRS